MRQAELWTRVDEDTPKGTPAYGEYDLLAKHHLDDVPAGAIADESDRRRSIQHLSRLTINSLTTLAVDCDRVGRARVRVLKHELASRVICCRG